MRQNIDSYIAQIEHDNKQYIIEGGYESVADYIISNAENGCGWHEFFCDEDYTDCTYELTEEQIDELIYYIRKHYDYMPD